MKRPDPRLRRAEKLLRELTALVQELKAGIDGECERSKEAQSQRSRWVRGKGEQCVRRERVLRSAHGLGRFCSRGSPCRGDFEVAAEGVGEPHLPRRAAVGFKHAA